MTPRQKLALGGLAVVGGLAAFFAATKTASAATAPTPQPRGEPRADWPADNMPWMMYSATTLSLQRKYNQLANSVNARTIEAGSEYEDEGVGLYVLISEDGVLGPESCEAFVFNLPRLSPGTHIPTACAGRV